MRAPCLIVAIVISLLIQGCSGTRPSTFYILNPIPRTPAPQITDTKTQGLGVLLGPLSIPEFLDRPQIVTRSSENILELAEFHRWGGSFQANILRILGENLSILLNSNRVLLFRQQALFPVDYGVTLDVKQFDGKLGSAIALKADWAVTDQRDRKKIVVKKSLIRETIKGSGYEAFVSAQSRALETLSKEIAEAIKKLAVDRDRSRIEGG